MKIEVEFSDEISEKEGFQILLDALAEFATRRGCVRDFSDETEAGARSYVRNRYGESPPMPFEEKVQQIVRRSTAARRAIVHRNVEKES